MTTNIIVNGLNPKPIVLPCSNSDSLPPAHNPSCLTPSQIFSQFCALPLTNLPYLKIYINNTLLPEHHHSTPLHQLNYSSLSAQSANNDLSITFLPKLLGGKGGFGNNLRGNTKRKKIEFNDDMMRNRHGQRLRDQRNGQLLAELEHQLRESNRAQGRGYLNASLRVTVQPNNPPIASHSQVNQTDHESQKQRVDTAPVLNSVSALSGIPAPQFNTTHISLKESAQANAASLKDVISNALNVKSTKSGLISTPSTSSSATPASSSPLSTPASDPALSTLKVAVSNMAQAYATQPSNQLTKVAQIGKKVIKEDHGLDLSSDDDDDDDNDSADGE